MAVRRVLFCRQHNGKFRTLARFRNHFDIAALPRYDLAGQIQANPHALSLIHILRLGIFFHNLEVILQRTVIKHTPYLGFPAVF